MIRKLFFLAFSIVLLASRMGLSQVYLDSTRSIDERVEDLLGRMTLAEKIGQMTQADRHYLADRSDISTYFLGSLLSGGGSAPADNSPEGWANMYDQFQNQALSTRLKIPLIYGIDAVHGHNNVKGAVIFPHNIGMGATWSPDLVEQAARITASEVAGTGIDWTFAPCIAVPRDERWGRTYEGFGETPEITQMMSAAAVKGFQGNLLANPESILACTKHFVGDGGTTGGRDQGNTQLDEQTLRAIHLPGYISAIKQGVGSIMASYNSWNGQKIHGNHYLLTTVLKEELGFRGFVVSDWAAIDQLPGNYDSDVEKAINAGIDMVMVPDKYVLFINTLKSLVLNGKISQQRIDDAVRRILSIKFKLGLFERPFTNRNLTEKIGSAEHRAVARQCVRESLVLLKKKDGILPLSKENNKIIVAGKSADNLGNQCGGWTISWQGASGNITEGTSILEAIQNTATSAQITYSANGSGAEVADVGIVVIGEGPYAEGPGDRNDLTISTEDITAVRNVKNSGVPTIVILISGRPMILSPILHYSDAIFAAWLPGTEGQGVADLLFGDFPPKGRLTHSWPKRMSQIPINFGDETYDPLFPYQFGILSFDDSPGGSAPEFQSGLGVSSGEKIELTFNKNLAPLTGQSYQFDVILNQTQHVEVSGVSIKQNDSTTIVLSLNKTFSSFDAISVDYVAGTIQSRDGGLLPPFHTDDIYNLLDENPVFKIPGKIEAEGYSAMFGIQTETTSDSGGGLNVGWIDKNDWMHYNVQVQTAGTYELAYRVASLSSSGEIHLIDLAKSKKLSALQLPVTGGWQNWRTVRTTVYLTEGENLFRLFAARGGFNLNWFTFNLITGVRELKTTPDDVQIIQNYPNPFNSQTTIEIILPREEKVTIELFNVVGQRVAKIFEGILGRGKHRIHLDANQLPSGVYISKVKSDFSEDYSIKKLVLIK